MSSRLLALLAAVALLASGILTSAAFAQARHSQRAHVTSHKLSAKPNRVINRRHPPRIVRHPPRIRHHPPRIVRRHHYVAPVYVSRPGRVVAPVVSAPVVTTDRCTCLSKEYTPEGAVLFRDLCTNEAAMNPPPQQIAAPGTDTPPSTPQDGPKYEKPPANLLPQIPIPQR